MEVRAMKAKHEQYLDALEYLGLQMQEALEHDDVERFALLVEKRSQLLPFIKAAIRSRDLSKEPGWQIAAAQIRAQSDAVHQAFARYDQHLLDAMRQARQAQREAYAHAA